MKILPISPLNVKSFLLYNTMEETFRQQGHEFVGKGTKADCCFLDLHSGHSNYDEWDLDVVLTMGVPVVCFDQFEYTNPPPLTREWRPGGAVVDLNPGTGNELGIWLERLFKNHQIKLWFMRRKPSKWIDFPDFVRPFDQVQYPGHDFEPVGKDELMHRPYDICFVGSICPWRENIMRDLLLCKSLKVDCEFVIERIPHEDWLNRHRQARLFVSGDGPGDCSDRPYQLPTIAPMLKFRNHHDLPLPWVHGQDCIEGADCYGNMEAGDEEMIKGFLKDPDWLHSIYLNGIHHFRQCTPEKRSLYILDQLQQAGIK